MRLELVSNPRLLIERLAELSRDHRRHRKLANTPGAILPGWGLDYLELLELLRPLSPQVIYDLGAHIGMWTVLAKSVFPSAVIHAFEPLEWHCLKFEDLTRGLPDVTLHRIALGSTPSRRDMQVPNQGHSASLLPLTTAGRETYSLEHEQSVAVSVEQLDDFIHRYNLPAPNLMKLDIQGYELEALRGSSNALAGASAILTEVSFEAFYEGQCLFHELVGFLAEKHFHLVGLGAATPLGHPLSQADCLFVNERYRSALRIVDRHP